MQYPETNNNKYYQNIIETPFLGFPKTLELCIEDVIPNMNDYKNLSPQEILRRISYDYFKRNLTKKILSYCQFKFELNKLAHKILKEKRGINYLINNEKEINLLKTESDKYFIDNISSLKRNNKTYVDYLNEAINSFHNKEATTQEIYQYFEDNFNELIKDKRNWKISVRVNLSRSNKFFLLAYKNPKKWGLTVNYS